MSLITDAKEHVEKMVPKLKGDDDFMPFLLVRKGDHLEYIGIATMADEFKDDIAAMMFAVLAANRAQEAVFGCVSYIITAPRNPDGSVPSNFGDVPPSEHPDRDEIAHLLHVTGDGDALHHAKLHRRNNRVLLGSWADPAHSLGGRFGRAMHAGLRAAAVLPADWDAIVAADRHTAIRGACGAWRRMVAEARGDAEPDHLDVAGMLHREKGHTDE